MLLLFQGCSKSKPHIQCYTVTRAYLSVPADFPNYLDFVWLH